MGLRAYFFVTPIAAEGETDRDFARLL